MDLSANQDCGYRDQPSVIGSCTNARIEDLRAATAQIRGGVSPNVTEALVVPGSGGQKLKLKQGAQISLRRQVFVAFGGLLHVLGMNPDQLGERVINRNFEGRQGYDG